MKSYRFYAPIYDAIFGRIMAEGRRRAAEFLSENIGGRILEIGVGTGLSLRHYHSDTEVVGIDVSREMLEKARRRVDRLGLRHVREIREMDAQRLDFPDDHFDGVAAAYVASVVPGPDEMMREAFRVCRPGGSVIVVNHFSMDAGRMRPIERVMAPFCHRLGFQPDFPLEDFLKLTGVEPESVEGVNFGGYWKLVHFRKPEE